MSSIDEVTVFAGKPDVTLFVEEDVDDEMTPKKLGSWVKVDYLGGFHICCAGPGSYTGGWCAGTVTAVGGVDIGFYF